LEAVVVAIIGLVGVLVGSILSPWLSARIEVSRAKSATRYERLNEAREYVSGNSFGVNNFSRKHFYLSLAPEMPSDLIRRIESFDSVQHEDPVADREDIRRRVLNELARIERMWELI
jgi:hypothetical protein